MFDEHENFTKKQDKEIKAASEAHEKYRNSKEFLDALNYLHKISIGFMGVLSISMMYSKRNPYVTGTHDYLTLRMGSYYVQTITAVMKLIEEGMLNAAKRELRFILESSVKFLSIDQNQSKLALQEKVNELNNLPDRFKDILHTLKLPFTEEDSDAYKKEVLNLYGSLSTYVHASTTQVEMDLNNFEKGIFFGFESVSMMNKLNQLAFKVYDASLVLIILSLGLDSAGDIFIALDSMPEWSYHRGKFVNLFNRIYDYKHERQTHI